jgi:catechol 2,3-dioxygenase-like lactoylglutathione lyase family enzyme
LAEALEIERVDFISVPTRDAARAVAFYRDVLGLPESEYADGEVEATNVTLSFWNPEEEGEPFQPSTAGIALRVPDVEAAFRQLETAGVDVIGIEDTGVCHMGFCKDPDGNVLILHRRYAPRAD